MTDKIKATRKLTNINFESEGSAVALVAKDQGGAANGFTTLIAKATNKISEQDIEKASMVTVTLPITEYLQKFFGLWWEDAEILARVFGYTTTEQDLQEETDYSSWYDDYINEKVEAVSIMKSLVIDKDEVDILKGISELSPQDYLTILKSQEVFEKNFDKVKTEVKKSSVKEGVTKAKALTTPSVENENKVKEDSMQEFISKSAMESALQEAITKALAPVQADLEKANQTIAALESEKKESIASVRKSKIAEVEKDATDAEELFKSLESVSDEAFEAVLKALSKKQSQVENADIMKEVGTEGRQVVTDEKPVDRTLEILKSQLKIQ